MNSSMRFVEIIQPHSSLFSFGRSVLIFFSLIWLLKVDFSFAQNKNRVEYPYGGVPDRTRRTWRMSNVIPINFDMIAVFRDAQFSKIANFASARFRKNVDFANATFDSLADFYHAQFDSSVDFSGTQFYNIADFSDSRFCGSANFCTLMWSAAVTDIATFHDRVDFEDVQFDGGVNFRFVQFLDAANFRAAQFQQQAIFTETDFHNTLNFEAAQFKSTVFFVDTKFTNTANFARVKFNSTVNFDKAIFKGTISFENTEFEEGVDLRRSNFDSVKTILLEGIKFPDGRFLCYWEQFKAEDNLRIVLAEFPKDTIDEQYRRVEIIYHQLRDNFLKQNDKNSADAVMYELGWQRAEIKKEFCWKLYGWSFGYGYQPWRFLLLVLVIAACFSALWYFKYYGIVACILNENDEGKTVFSALKKKEGKLFSKQIGILRGKDVGLKANIFDHSSISKHISILQRMWHVLLFSFSVLLGIRWKKEWSDIKYNGMFGSNTFLKVVTLEYLLGLLLYLMFALLVKGSRFEYIKGLLGF